MPLHERGRASGNNRRSMSRPRSFLLKTHKDQATSYHTIPDNLKKSIAQMEQMNEIKPKINHFLFYLFLSAGSYCTILFVQ